MARGGGGLVREEEEELKGAKRGYREAAAEGNREEEARWANVIGDIHKRRGEYVEALRWLRTDYDVTVKHLPQRHLIESCQSLGEVYLRLGKFSEALTYQKKHLQLAKESDNLVEQQRANTQLGRTYHEILLRSENDHSAIRNAKKYFKSAMKLVRNLKENGSSEKSTYLKELIDAYNNMGMLELELENFEEAEKLLLEGLRICDEEEGQALSKVNTGNVLDSCGKWAGALQAFEEGYRIAMEGDLPSVQLSALENMQYSHMVRFNNIEEAKKLQEEIDNLKQILNQHEARNTIIDYYPETESEGGDVSNDIPDSVDSDGHDANTYSEEPDDDVVLASFVHRSRSSSNIKASKIHSIPKKVDTLCDMDEGTEEVITKSCCHQSGRKRVFMVISDDEADESPEIGQSKRTLTSRTNSVSTSGLFPIIGELKCCGNVLDGAESTDYIGHLASEQKCIDAVIDDWVPKRLMKLYVDFCTKLSEVPNKKLLTKLYNLEVSEDEIIVSNCGLQDLSITPFLDALRSHKTTAMLDLSHNMLGNDQLEELRMAENTNLALEQTLLHFGEDMQDVSTCTGHQHGNSAEARVKTAPGNADVEKMVVADSEDEAVNEDHRAASGASQNCASSCQRNSYSGCRVIQELAEAIASAKQLKVFDLSQNGLSEEAMQWLYSAWASGERGDGMARKHVSKEVVHFSVDGISCCRLKPCCRRDLQM
ncbi:hypothetical protein ACQ4PT_023195 [Festuca glaucescens]